MNKLTKGSTMEKQGLKEAEKNMLEKFEAMKEPELSQDEIYEGIGRAMHGPIFEVAVQKLRDLMGEDLVVVAAEEKRRTLLGLFCSVVEDSNILKENIKLINAVRFAETWEHFREKDLLGDTALVLAAMIACELATSLWFPEMVEELTAIVKRYVSMTGDAHKACSIAEVAYSLALAGGDQKSIDLHIELLQLLDRYTEALDKNFATAGGVH